MRRVARRQVFLSFDALVEQDFWLVDDYFPEILDARRGARRLHVGGDRATCSPCARVEPVLVPADCIDGFAACYWNRPEAYVDPDVQAGISCLAQLDPDVRAPRDRAAARATSRRARGTRATAHLRDAAPSSTSATG